MDLFSYQLGKKAGGGGGGANLQNNKEVSVASNGTTTINPDTNYDGMKKVTLTTNVQPNLESKSVTISTNTVTTITPTSGKDGMSSVEVTTAIPGPSGNINITNTNVIDVTNYATAQVVDSDLVAENIKKDVNILGITGTYEGSGGLDWSAIGYSGTPQVLTDDYNHSKNIYDNWDASQTNLKNKFMQDINLIYMPLVDTSNAKNMQNMFFQCFCLKEIPLLDTSNVTDMSGMFRNSWELSKISQIDTSNVTNMSGMFYVEQISKLNNVPLLDCSSIINIQGILGASSSAYRNNLTNIGGFKDLGKAYDTSQSANFSRYELKLSDSTLLSYDSLMNVINNLYDIATKGCNTQSLTIGATNLAKLSSAEIQIATDKGWTVS